MTWSLLLIMITSHWDFWYTLYSKESSLLQLQPPSSWCYAGVIIINCIRLLMLHQNEVSRSLSSCFLLFLLLAIFISKRTLEEYLTRLVIFRSFPTLSWFFKLFFQRRSSFHSFAPLFSRYYFKHTLLFVFRFNFFDPLWIPLERFNFMEASNHEQRLRLACCSFIWKGWCCRLLKESTPSDALFFENEEKETLCCVFSLRNLVLCILVYSCMSRESRVRSLLFHCNFLISSGDYFLWDSLDEGLVCSAFSFRL